jgi:hypothetical protein
MSQSIIEKAVIYVNNYIQTHFHFDYVLNDEEDYEDARLRFIDKWIDDFNFVTKDGFVIDSSSDLVVAMNYCIQRNSDFMVDDFNQPFTLKDVTNSFLQHILIDKCSHNIH